MAITLIKTEKRENNWTRFFFRDGEGYEFFVQKPNEERIREKVKNPNHPVGKNYQREGLVWETRNREVIDSSPQQVAENWYNIVYKKGEIPEQPSDEVKELWNKINSLQEEIDRLKKEKSDQSKELTTIIFRNDSDIDNISFNDLKVQAEKNNEEWEIEIEHAEVMDNWYQRLLKEEKGENERLKKRIRELETKIELPPK